MRFFEVALISILSLRTLAFLIPLASLRLGLSVIALIATVCHLFIEGWRWQMIPLYVLAALLLLIDVSQLKQHKRQLRAFFICLPLLLVFIALPIVLPVPKLPIPTGPYAIGTSHFEILDESRNRKLPVRVWYPTDDVTGLEEAGWLNHMTEMIPALAFGSGLPEWAVRHVTRMKANSYLEAKIIEGNTPIVLFVHGQYGFKAQSSYLAEELASQGYAFVAADHVGGALLTVYDDGSTVDYTPSEFAEGLEGAEFDAVIRELGQRWMDDLIFVLDNLESKVSQLNLDSSKVVASGHSTGGGVSFEFCRNDERCAGVVALDPWLLPSSDETFDKGIDAPLLSLFSDPRLVFFETPNHAAFESLAEATQASGHVVREKVIVDSKHHEFSDAALLSPWGYLLGMQKGPIRTHRSMQITTEQSLALLKHVFEGNAPQWREFAEEIDWVEGY